MNRHTKLTSKQLAFIDELFDAGLDSEQAMKKHKITAALYRRWQNDPSFKAEFDRRIEWLRRQSETLIAKYASVAAAKLIQLTDSDKQETARKACLDIISLCCPDKTSKNTPSPDGHGQSQPLSPETADRLLNALAKEKKSQ